MHFARLVKQAGVDLVSRPICLYGAYTDNDMLVVDITSHTIQKDQRQVLTSHNTMVKKTWDRP